MIKSSIGFNHCFLSDASPLIALALCGKLDLLDKLFDQVCIPQAVYRELTVPNKPKVKEITEWAKDRIVSVKNAAAQTAADKNTAHFPGLCSPKIWLAHYHLFPLYYF